MILRDYQARCVAELWQWFRKNQTGNVCIVLPTGAGKSVVLSEIIRQAHQNWGSKILKLTHIRELVDQNAKALRRLWPNAPMGIVSAGLNRKEWGEPITFASIQTVRGKGDWLGHTDLVIVDEAHLISHKDEGSYRELVQELTTINPFLRVIGLTASPYRLGHGMITDKPAIFDDIIEPVSIIQLQVNGYLAKLRSKHTEMTYNTDGVHRRGGDFIQSELQQLVDNKLQNDQAVDETIKRSGDRLHWLFFCTGVDHAYHIRDCLRERGITAETVTGELSNGERDRILNDFKAGKIKALTNVEVLTTGFDYPDIDLIALMRPTESPGLYLQMVGRGLRLKSHVPDCLILDFAGNIARHGPITAIKPPGKKGEGGGVAPSKVCPECYEIMHPTVKICPGCGFIFPETGPLGWKLSNLDIMGQEEETMEMVVTGWHWTTQTSKNSGIEMIVCKYESMDYAAPRLKEFYCVNHDGFTGIKAKRKLAETMNACGCYMPDTDALTKSPPPVKVFYRRQKDNPKFFEVVGKEWIDEKDIPF